MLKEKWFSLTDDEKHTWTKWEEWDAKRFDRDKVIFEKECRRKSGHNDMEHSRRGNEKDTVSDMHIPKKRKGHDMGIGSPLSSIPKKRRS